MARTHLSAAFLLVAAGVSGCSSGAAFVQTDDAGVKVVSVPHSTLFQWYYRNAAISFIRETDPNFKEDQIINERKVVVSAAPRLGRDGKPVVGDSIAASKSDSEEWHITYRPTMAGNQPVNGRGVVPAGAMQNSNYGRNPNGGVVPAGGMQGNVSPTMQPTGTQPAGMQPYVDPRSAQPPLSYPNR